MSGDWVALGAGQEEWVPSWVLLYFWASPWGWLCPGSSRNQARGWHRAENPKGAAAAEAEVMAQVKHGSEPPKTQLSTPKGH